jgi:hypothetical protein
LRAILEAVPGLVCRAAAGGAVKVFSGVERPTVQTPFAGPILRVKTRHENGYR